MSKSFLLTTPLFPAVGLDVSHCSLAVFSDAIARYRNCIGQKAAVITPISGTFSQRDESTGERSVLAGLELGYSRTVSTASPAHQEAVVELFRLVESSRLISRRLASFCTRCGTLVSSGDRCSNCDGPIESVTEASNIFQLSQFHEKLLGFYHDNPEFVLPGSRMNEVVNQVRAGLADICVSRIGGRSGIPVPGNEGHSFTTLLSGLAGYLTATGFPKSNDQSWCCWPADAQVGSRESLRTHAIFWPALLMAAGLQPPRHIVCLGDWKLDRESGYLAGRQSVPADELTAVLPADYVRYFLLRDMALGSDASFSYDSLLDRVNYDLATEYSNLASRVFKMLENYSDNKVPAPGDLEAAEENLRRFCLETVELHRENFERFQVSRALANIQELVAVTGKYIVINEPWVLARDPSKKQRLNTILYCAAEALRLLSVMLWPVVPVGVGSVLASLSGEQVVPLAASFGWGELRPGKELRGTGAVFPRIDRRTFSAALESSRQREESVEENKPEVNVPPQGEDKRISIEDFAKVEMRVAKVTGAERVAQSEKLIKLQVDLGNETRQVVAGIGKAYEPESLLGRYVVVVTNLKPAKLMGVVSDGMIVAASQGGVPVLVGFTEPVELGARLK